MTGRCNRSDLRLRSIIAMEAVTSRERGGATGRSDLTLAVHPIIARREEVGRLRDRTLNSVCDWMRKGCVRSSLTYADVTALCEA
jgi:hypothetical protein